MMLEIKHYQTWKKYFLIIFAILLLLPASILSNKNREIQENDIIGTWKLLQTETDMAGTRSPNETEKEILVITHKNYYWITINQKTDIVDRIYGGVYDIEKKRENEIEVHFHREFANKENFLITDKEMIYAGVFSIKDQKLKLSEYRYKDTQAWHAVGPIEQHHTLERVE